MSSFSTEVAAAQTMLRRACRVCGVEGSDEQKLLRCGTCKVAFYCGRQHQKDHWKLHKPKCKKHTGPKTTFRDIGRSLELDGSFLTTASKVLSEKENKDLAEKLLKYRENSIPFAALCDHLVELLVPTKKWLLLGDVQYLASETFDNAKTFYEKVEDSRRNYKEAKTMPLFPNVVCLIMSLRRNIEESTELLYKIALMLNNQVIRDELEDLDPVQDILAHGGDEIIFQAYDRGYKEDAQLEEVLYQVKGFIEARKPKPAAASTG